jgi:hypothetical protein
VQKKKQLNKRNGDRQKACASLLPSFSHANLTERGTIGVSTYRYTKILTRKKGQHLVKEEQNKFGLEPFTLIYQKYELVLQKEKNELYK